MNTNYDTPEAPTSMAEEPAVAYKVRSNRRMRVEPKVPHMQPTSPNAHTPEEMHTILTERIRKAEAGEEDVVPHQVVLDTIRSKYGF